jgi:ssDNA-specific exonuclease RecJ
LNGVKKKLNIENEETAFDEDELIDVINTGFATLNQMGVNPGVVYSIESAENEWSEFSTDPMVVLFAKTYMFLYVKQIFDISTVSAKVIDAYEAKLKELSWRLNLHCDILKK